MTQGGIQTVSDDALMQEVLRRQIENLKQKPTNNLNNQRLQNLIQRQLDRSKYQQEVIRGENERYNRQLLVRPNQIENNPNIINNMNHKVHCFDSVPKITESDIDKMIFTINKQLENLSMPTLPTNDSFKEGGSQNIQRFYEIVSKLQTEINETKEKYRTELQTTEKDLFEQQHQQKVSIKRKEKEIDQQQQQLQMLRTEISNEELAMKEERKNFMLKMRPKKQMVEKLERRTRVLREAQ